MNAIVSVLLLTTTGLLADAAKAPAKPTVSVSDAMLERFDENRNGRLDVDEVLGARTSLRNLLQDRSESKIVIEKWRADLRKILAAFDASQDGILDANEKKRSQLDLEKLLSVSQPKEPDDKRTSQSTPAKRDETRSEPGGQSESRTFEGRQGYGNYGVAGRGYGNAPRNVQFNRGGGAAAGFGTASGTSPRPSTGVSNRGTADFAKTSAGRLGGDRPGAGDPGQPRGGKPDGPSGSKGSASPDGPSGSKGGDFSFPGIRDKSTANDSARGDHSVPDGAGMQAMDVRGDEPFRTEVIRDTLAERVEQLAGTGSEEAAPDKKAGTGGVNRNEGFNPVPNF